MPLCLPWLWGRGLLQLGGLPTTQGQPSKCPAVGQACWIRAKAGHLLNLRLGSNELRLAVTPPLAVGPRSTPAGRTARHPGTTPKCPAVGQGCRNRAKAEHLLSPRNLRLWSLSLCPEFQLSGQQLSGYDSGFSASAQSFNFLGSNFPIMTQD